MFENKLLENAQHSIQLGIEDYELSKTVNKRSISAIRNIFAGLLLLYKYKLLKESPTDKPFYYITKLSNAIYNDNFGTNPPRQTIDVTGIKSVFKALRIAIDTKLLDNVNKVRNDIEHFYNLNNVDISSLVNKSFLLISKFYSKYILPETGVDIKDFLGKGNYKTLLENQEVYKIKKHECHHTFEKIDFPSDEVRNVLLENQKCPNCQSELIKAQNKDYENLVLMCNYCLKNNLDIYDVLGLTHKELLRGEDYRCECPECDDFNVIYGVCFSCGYELEDDQDYEWEDYLQYLIDENG